MTEGPACGALFRCGGREFAAGDADPGFARPASGRTRCRGAARQLGVGGRFNRESSYPSAMTPAIIDVVLESPGGDELMAWAQRAGGDTARRVQATDS